MHNLTQIKSKQFHKFSTIQPFIKSSSNRLIEDEKIINRHLTLMHQANQNNCELANAVKKIQQIKPRTAPKISSKKNLRSRKTEIIQTQKPSLQFNCNNVMPHQQSIKQDEEDDQDKTFKSSLSRQKRHFNFLQIDNRLTSKTSKSSRTLKRQFFRNSLEAIDDECKIIQAKLSKKPREKLDLGSNTQDIECRIRITKRKTEHQIPRSKISIKNLDDQIDVPRHFQSKKKKSSTKYDLNVPKPSFKIKQFQEDCQNQYKNLKERRTKKSITDFKVPDFIKISLQAYRHEPTYLIDQLKRLKNKQKSTENASHNQNFEKMESLEQINVISREKDDYGEKQEQKIFTNKIKLVEKDRKKISMHVQTQIPILQNRDMPIQENRTQQIKKQRIKAKSKKEDLLQKINICGWEEDGPTIRESHYFKL